MWDYEYIYLCTWREYLLNKMQLLQCDCYFTRSMGFLFVCLFYWKAGKGQRERQNLKKASSALRWTQGSMRTPSRVWFQDTGHWRKIMSFNLHGNWDFYEKNRNLLYTVIQTFLETIMCDVFAEWDLHQERSLNTTCDFVCPVSNFAHISLLLFSNEESDMVVITKCIRMAEVLL